MEKFILGLLQKKGKDWEIKNPGKTGILKYIFMKNYKS